MAKILIVDDSRTSRRMLRNILVENGHEVIGEAENGQIGFEKYIELKPDIVTLDNDAGSGRSWCIGKNHCL